MCTFDFALLATLTISNKRPHVFRRQILVLPVEAAFKRPVPATVAQEKSDWALLLLTRECQECCAPHVVDAGFCP